ncbi:lytic transglycosylase domain-containing protein [Litorisediminicola beolgyonensis]|uniref:Lytic transglycosylase domain-containing protein n=1 Tax=Litorisediminicola beolgyonensis TaxID=1173614 RepID=A0ABW3ZK03_9RHOB
MPSTTDDPAPLRRAMADMRDANWASAMIEARGSGQAGLDVILWHWLRAGNGDARQVQDFLARNPDWPGLDYLREKSEQAISEATHDEVRAFFGNEAPQTGTGALSLARAERAAGEEDAAKATIILAWKTLALSSEEHAAFLADHGALLKPYHDDRLAMALWKGWRANASAMLPLVSDGQRALAEARIALQDQAAGVDGAIERVPAALADDAGLAHDRFAWRVKKRRTDDAIELLLERSAKTGGLGEPWAWADRRLDLARATMLEGKGALAYDIASSHQLTSGSDFASLEWLSGYIALTYLKKPEIAADHFDRFATAVDTPISLGRAGYWQGRAREAMGDAEGAARGYAFGAKYQTSFYGLLAAERGKLAPDTTLAGTETFPDWKEAAFTKKSVFQAAMLLMAGGEDQLAERFLTHLAESLDRNEIGSLGNMLADLGKPHIQIMLGKRAAQAGIEVPGPYYALHPLLDREFPIPTEMVLSIARRESEFDPVVVSHAGARGLMQLMPRTASEVSGWIGETFLLAKLTSDPAYNARLGSAYLADLSERFDGNVVMMAAGYNAGPGRPIRWMKERGDPRRGGADIVDWIEHIPFDETRNYVMRVAESVPIYRARLGKTMHPVPFSKELTGSTLPRQ